MLSRIRIFSADGKNWTTSLRESSRRIEAWRKALFYPVNGASGKQNSSNIYSAGSSGSRTG
jgi:hypothetical protein